MLTPHDHTHGTGLDQRAGESARQVRVQVIRRDVVVAEVRLGAQGDDEGDGDGDERHGQPDAHVVPVALVLGEHDEGEEQQAVEHEADDGDVVGDVRLLFEGVAVDPVGGRAGEAAFDGVVAEGQVGAEAVGDVCRGFVSGAA